MTEVSCEMQALLDAAAQQCDDEIVRILAPNHTPTRPLALEVEGVPGELIGLAALRGHAALLSRLLDLADRTRPAVERQAAASAAASVAASAVCGTPIGLGIGPVPSDKEQRASALRACVKSHLEGALLRGDHEAVDAMVSDYDRALAEGHLTSPPLEDALPALTSLCASRGDQASLDALRSAGAESWALSIRSTRC